MILLGECKAMHAKITERQCGVNRQGGHISCQGCAGLSQPAQVTLPQREEGKEMAKEKVVYLCKVAGCGRKRFVNGLCYIHDKERKAGNDPNFVPADEKPEQVPVGQTETSGLKRPIDAHPVEEAPEVVRDEVKTWVKESLEELEGKPKPTGLAALLRIPPQPPEPDGLLIPFTREEVVALIESDITAQDIRDLAIMLLAGELQRVAVA